MSFILIFLFFVGMSLILLGGINMMAYYSGWYTKGGRTRYLKRHYALMIGGLAIGFFAGFVYEHFYPPTNLSKICNASDCSKDQ